MLKFGTLEFHNNGLIPLGAFNGISAAAQKEVT
jgi:hypothetical protein